MIFLAIGIAFMVLAQEYRMGTGARMGPGYFPTALGGLMAALGLTLVVPAFMRDGEPFPRLHMRQMLMILASIVVFALLLQPLGFVLAALALIVVGGLADPDLRFLESVALAIFLSAFSVVVFVMLLGLPLPLWPSF